MEKSTGSTYGSILLVSGCCIGAGMLGLPVLSALAGFTPSVFMFVLSWLFMTCTGLLLLEVNLWFKEDVSIISMAGRTLGLFGKIVAWIGFLFLFYSLMVAYIAGTGSLFTDFVFRSTRFLFPDWIGSMLFIFLFGILIYLGTIAVDYFNRLLMLGLIVSYLLLVGLGISHVNPDFLTHVCWEASFLVLPSMIISFGFHNLVPSLTRYLNHDRKKLIITFVAGSAIPLVIYLIWEYLILGLIPIDGESGFQKALEQGNMATQALRAAVGASWVVVVAEYFAFFSIVTSFLGVALSFVDFLIDGLNLPRNYGGKGIACLLALAPPFAFALLYPKVFLIALQYAGAFGAVTLFGLLPAIMVWRGRYSEKMAEKPIVPGGRAVLSLVILFACAVMGLQFIDIIGVNISR